MFQQQFNNNFQQPMYGGFNQYGNFGQQPQEKFNNTLDAAEIEKLKKNKDQFSLHLTEEEILKAGCNHRTENGDNYAFTELGNDELVCNICGSKFRIIPDNESEEDIAERVQYTLDILESVKTFYLGLPKEVVKEYFQMIPLLKKLPKLYSAAMQVFNQHNPDNNNYYGRRDMSIASQYQNLASMFTQPNPYIMQQYGQQSMYNQANPAPGAYGYAGAATPQQNPFVAQPQPNTGYAYAPNVGQATAPVQPTVQQPQPQVQPQPTIIDAEPAPEGKGKTTVKESFNV